MKETWRVDKQQFLQEAEALGIGNTPLMPYEEDFAADIFVKNECMNATGSVKDRAALAMILDAEAQGILHKGDTIVEATSGNMGISLAYVCLKRGYRLVLAMPETMSSERRTLLRGLGAQLVLTDGKAGMQGAVQYVEQLQQEGYVWLKQFQNPANAMAHHFTAEEIARQVERVDFLVAGVGTGGTLCGTARRLKQIFPQCKVVAVEPFSCATISKGTVGAHAIQGIGAGFVPQLYDKSLVDSVQLVEDDQALDMFFTLNKVQGYNCGISAAANIVVACRLACQENAGKNIVTFFPDGDDRYLSLLHKGRYSRAAH